MNKKVFINQNSVEIQQKQCGRERLAQNITNLSTELSLRIELPTHDCMITGFHGRSRE